MKLRGKGAVIIGRNAEGEEVRSPPAPYINVANAEALTLIRLGVAEAVDQAEFDAAYAEETAPKAAEPVPELAPEAVDETPEVVEEPAADEGSEDAPVIEAEVAEDAAEEVAEDEVADEVAEVVEEAPEVVEVVAPEVVEPTAREIEINDAIDILDADHFVKTGARAGHPKVDALKAVLGEEYDDLTAAEVDAVFAKRAAA